MGARDHPLRHRRRLRRRPQRDGHRALDRARAGSGPRSPPRRSTRWSPGGDHGPGARTGGAPVARPAWSGSASSQSSCFWRTTSTPTCRWPTPWPRSRGCAAPDAIGAYGVSNFDAGQLEAALSAGSPAAIQNSCSLLEQDDLAEVLPLCERRAVAYLGVQPAGRRLADRQVPPRRAVPGGLADDPAPRALRRSRRPRPDVRRARGAGARSRSDRGMSMAGAALAWLLADPRSPRWSSARGVPSTSTRSPKRWRSRCRPTSALATDNVCLVTTCYLREARCGC